MVIAGLGHLEYRFGVPERVDQHKVVSEDETVIISVRHTEDVGAVPEGACGWH